MGELEDLKPLFVSRLSICYFPAERRTYTRDKRQGPRGDDCPRGSAGDKCLQERSGAGNLDGVGTVTLGKEPFHVLDIYGFQTVRRVLREK